MNMNKSVLTKCSFLLAWLVLLLGGCSKEQSISMTDIGDPVEVRLNVNASATTSASSNETDINRVRVIVFGSVGSSDARRLVLNKFHATVPAGNSISELITAGKRDIYIIVNEPLAGGGTEQDSYRNIASVDDIRNLSLAYQGAGSLAIYTPSEIPMFISHINKHVLIDNANEISGSVERTMAKVTMKLNVKRSNFPDTKYVVIDNIVIKNLPQSNNFIAKLYNDVLLSSEMQSANVVVAQSGYDFSYNNTFYVPEYILGNPANGAYIEITGHINGEQSRVAKWSVKLGDAMDDSKSYGDRYDITRNRHYTFVGDVKSYGLMDDLEVKVTVLPWNTVNMDEEVGRYVSYLKITDASNVDIADGSNLDDMGQTIKVSCNTNVGGWYAVVRNAKGGVVHTSAPTAAVTTAAEQTVDVVVPKLLGPHYESEAYTMNIYHPTIANEGIGPVKVVSFTQFGSYIPTFVLATAGWPADRLPKTGLQIATRGDGVLPGGTPAADDPMMQWKTSNTSTSGVESVSAFANAKLGIGKSSTDAMTISSQVGLHPAAAYCRAMGPEWYLPSVAELKLIYNNVTMLGASYSFSANYYWSATEYSSVNSWNVYFGNGYEYVSNKTSTNRVRCLREI